MNLLETVDDPESVIASLTGCLKPGGVWWCWSRRARFCLARSIRGWATSAASTSRSCERFSNPTVIHIEREHQINKIGALSWWFFGKILHRAEDESPRPEIVGQDRVVLAARRLVLLPWRGLSLVIVARLKAK